ncbi:MAG: response regulator [Chloroflexota bacterium]|nr:response regulator [Chloroflexota bacterium]
MKTILLIEDYADNARLVMRALKPYDYRVLHAVDGETGLMMAVDEQPDLILLDLGLPDVEGQTLVSLIRNAPGLEQVPIIAVTAWPPATARRMVEAYGCNSYISKPISPKTFPSQIAAYFAPEDDE